MISFKIIVFAALVAVTFSHHIPHGGLVHSRVGHSHHHEGQSKGEGGLVRVISSVSGQGTEDGEGSGSEVNYHSDGDSGEERGRRRVVISSRSSSGHDNSGVSGKGVNVRVNDFSNVAVTFSHHIPHGGLVHSRVGHSHHHEGQSKGEGGLVRVISSVSGQGTEDGEGSGSEVNYHSDGDSGEERGRRRVVISSRSSSGHDNSGVSGKGVNVRVNDFSNLKRKALYSIGFLGQGIKGDHRASSIFKHLSTRPKARSVEDVLDVYLTGAFGAGEIIDSWVPGLGKLFSSVAVASAKINFCLGDGATRARSNRPGTICSNKYGSNWGFKAERESSTYNSAKDYITAYGLHDGLAKFKRLLSTHAKVDLSRLSGSQKVVAQAIYDLFQNGRFSNNYSWSKKDVSFVFSRVITVLAALGSSYHRNVGPIIVNDLCDYSSAIGNDNNGLKLSALKDDIRKFIVNAKSHSWENVIKVCSDDDYRNIIREQVRDDDNTEESSSGPNTLPQRKRRPKTPKSDDNDETDDNNDRTDDANDDTVNIDKKKNVKIGVVNNNQRNHDINREKNDANKNVDVDDEDTDKEKRLIDDDDDNDDRDIKKRNRNTNKKDAGKNKNDKVNRKDNNSRDINDDTKDKNNRYISDDDDDDNQGDRVGKGDTQSGSPKKTTSKDTEKPKNPKEKKPKQKPLTSFRIFWTGIKGDHSASKIFKNLSKKPKATKVGDVLDVYLTGAFGAGAIIDSWAPGLGKLFSSLAVVSAKINYCSNNGLFKLPSSHLGSICTDKYGSKWGLKPIRQISTSNKPRDYITAYGLDDGLTKFRTLLKTHVKADLSSLSGSQKIVAQAIYDILQNGRFNADYSWSKKDVSFVFSKVITVLAALGSSYHKNVGPTIVDNLCDYSSDIGSASNGLDLSSLKNQIKQVIVSANSHRWQQVIKECSDGQYKKIVQKQDRGDYDDDDDDDDSEDSSPGQEESDSTRDTDNDKKDQTSTSGKNKDNKNGNGKNKDLENDDNNNKQNKRDKEGTSTDTSTDSDTDDDDVGFTSENNNKNANDNDKKKDVKNDKKDKNKKNKDDSNKNSPVDKDTTDKKGTSTDTSRDSDTDNDDDDSTFGNYNENANENDNKKDLKNDKKDKNKKNKDDFNKNSPVDKNTTDKKGTSTDTSRDSDTDNDDDDSTFGNYNENTNGNDNKKDVKNDKKDKNKKNKDDSNKNSPVDKDTTDKKSTPENNKQPESKGKQKPLSSFIIFGKGIKKDHGASSIFKSLSKKPKATKVGDVLDVYLTGAIGAGAIIDSWAPGLGKLFSSLAVVTAKINYCTNNGPFRVPSSHLGSICTEKYGSNWGFKPDRKVPTSNKPRDYINAYGLDNGLTKFKTLLNTHVKVDLSSLSGSQKIVTQAIYDILQNGRFDADYSWSRKDVSFVFSKVITVLATLGSSYHKNVGPTIIDNLCDYSRDVGNNSNGLDLSSLKKEIKKAIASANSHRWQQVIKECSDEQYNKSVQNQDVDDEDDDDDSDLGYNKDNVKNKDEKKVAQNDKDNKKQHNNDKKGTKKDSPRDDDNDNSDYDSTPVNNKKNDKDSDKKKDVKNDKKDINKQNKDDKDDTTNKSPVDKDTTDKKATPENNKQPDSKVKRKPLIAFSIFWNGIKKDHIASSIFKSLSKKPKPTKVGDVLDVYLTGAFGAGAIIDSWAPGLGKLFSSLAVVTTKINYCSNNGLFKVPSSRLGSICSDKYGSNWGFKPDREIPNSNKPGDYITAYGLNDGLAKFRTVLKTHVKADLSSLSGSQKIVAQAIYDILQNGRFNADYSWSKKDVSFVFSKVITVLAALGSSYHKNVGPTIVDNLCDYSSDIGSVSNGLDLSSLKNDIKKAIVSANSHRWQQVIKECSDDKYNKIVQPDKDDDDDDEDYENSAQEETGRDGDDDKTENDNGEGKDKKKDTKKDKKTEVKNDKKKDDKNDKKDSNLQNKEDKKGTKKDSPKDVNHDLDEDYNKNSGNKKDDAKRNDKKKTAENDKSNNKQNKHNKKGRNKDSSKDSINDDTGDSNLRNNKNDTEGNDEIKDVKNDNNKYDKHDRDSNKLNKEDKKGTKKDSPKDVRDNIDEDYIKNSGNKKNDAESNDKNNNVKNDKSNNKQNKDDEKGRNKDSSKDGVNDDTGDSNLENNKNDAKGNDEIRDVKNDKNRYDKHDKDSNKPNKEDKKGIKKDSAKDVRDNIDEDYIKNSGNKKNDAKSNDKNKNVQNDKSKNKHGEKGRNKDSSKDGVNDDTGDSNLENNKNDAEGNDEIRDVKNDKNRYDKPDKDSNKPNKEDKKGTKKDSPKDVHDNIDEEYIKNSGNKKNDAKSNDKNNNVKNDKSNNKQNKHDEKGRNKDSSKDGVNDDTGDSNLENKNNDAEGNDKNKDGNNDKNKCDKKDKKEKEGTKKDSSVDNDTAEKKGKPENNERPDNTEKSDSKTTKDNQAALSSFGIFWQRIRGGHRASAIFKTLSTKPKSTKLSDVLDVYLTGTFGAGAIIDSWVPGLGKLFSSLVLASTKINYCLKDGVFSDLSSKLGSICSNKYGSDWGFKIESDISSYDDVSDYITACGLNDGLATFKRLLKTHTKSDLSGLVGSQKVVAEAIRDCFESGRFSTDYSWTKKDVTFIFSKVITVLGALGSSYNPKFGPSLVDELLNYSSEIGTDSNGLVLIDLRQKIKKSIASCQSHSWNNVINFSSEEEYSKRDEKIDKITKDKPKTQDDNNDTGSNGGKKDEEKRKAVDSGNNDNEADRNSKDEDKKKNKHIKVQTTSTSNQNNYRTSAGRQQRLHSSDADDIDDSQNEGDVEGNNAVNKENSRREKDAGSDSRGSDLSDSDSGKASERRILRHSHKSNADSASQDGSSYSRSHNDNGSEYKASGNQGHQRSAHSNSAASESSIWNDDGTRINEKKESSANSSNQGSFRSERKSVKNEDGSNVQEESSSYSSSSSSRSSSSEYEQSYS